MRGFTITQSLTLLLQLSTHVCRAWFLAGFPAHKHTATVRLDYSGTVFYRNPQMQPQVFQSDSFPFAFSRPLCAGLMSKCIPIAASLHLAQEKGNVSRQQRPILQKKKKKMGPGSVNTFVRADYFYLLLTSACPPMTQVSMSNIR